MFHKILVAIDMSVIAKHVFDEALSLAKANGATVMLLHILSAEEENSPLPILWNHYYPVMNDKLREYQKQWKVFEKQGLELLQSLTDEATAVGVNTEFTQINGSPGQTICDFACNWEADLIIIGRRGHSGLSELILGSVSNYVLHHAPCSVLTVQHSVDVNTESVQVDQAVLLCDQC